MKKIILTSVLVLLAVIFVSAQESNLNQTDAKGLKQGQWEEKITTGVSKGLYVNDQKEGNWITYGPNGNLLRIEAFSKGLREGVFVEIDQRGYLVTETYYKNNLLEGVAKKYYYGTNPASVIDYKAGKINGKKKVYYENAAGKVTEESEYTDDIKNGTSNFFAINGDPIAEFIYKDGQLEGVQKSYYPGKKLLSEQNYLHNLESGLYKEYYESGKVKIESNYKAGKLEGPYKEYNEDGGLLNEGAYVDGEKEGKWTEYDGAGKILKVVKFTKGVEKK
ncbi:MAG: toxin-antitoxin system YwqK family antitoxin [Bacteroidetes bacterium]|nr:toxin-antitoxin system YwqK family antitoxin [Bacteroidota bacterium]